MDLLCAASRNGKDVRAGAVLLYGWDAVSRTWHGPNEVGRTNGLSRLLLQNLKSASGRSWYGPVRCSAPGGPRVRFFTLIHALRDSAVAMVYCGDSKAGPAEIVAVIPAGARARLRPEFAFEFVAFASFLGSIGEGADLSVHDGITAALREARESDSLVLSLSTGLWASDPDPVLSHCVESIAVTMLRWLGE